jgi:acetyl/propionyl-CoA carboxylase alpha subunit
MNSVDSMNVEVKALGRGMYRVDYGTEDDRRGALVYVTGAPGSRWLFWNGKIYREEVEDIRNDQRADSGIARTLTAPMPATVLKVNVKPGDTVKRGDVVVLLEAMKMEMPVRAEANASVAVVHCREGELVAADSPLVEFQ